MNAVEEVAEQVDICSNIGLTYRGMTLSVVPLNKNTNDMHKRQPLDIYDDIPHDMRVYLQHNGWNFNKRACEYAVSRMRKLNPATNKLERIEPYTKDQVDELLKKYNITIENNIGYNYVFAANMCKADYLKSSIADEQHLALYVKDVIDDSDAAEGVTMRRWYATMVANGEMVDWADIL